MAIKKLYLEKGYPDAEVSHQIVPSSDPSLWYSISTSRRGAGRFAEHQFLREHFDIRKDAEVSNEP
jgi:hypothetical protein